MMSTQEAKQSMSLLIHGYCRKMQSQYGLYHVIPTSIILLLFDYFFVANPYSYEWTIRDLSTIQQIKSAPPTKAFYSPKFYIYPPLRWQIELFPNGEDLNKTGNVCIYLC